MRASGLVLIVAGVLLSACSERPAHVSSPAERKAARRADAERLASADPKRHTYRFDAGELVVLDIPTVAEGGFADSQKCFLWRDREYKTASLQCPNDAPGDLPRGHAEPDKNQP